MTRAFNAKQKAALYMLTDGRCATCQRELDQSWHADHVQPWSKGGHTDVLNGQALCQKCNLAKGAKMLRPWPESLALRDWQEAALNRFLSHNHPDFLAVATPGAGKTLFALKAAHEMLRGTATRLITVSPSCYLKYQMADDAHSVGVNLDPDWENNCRSLPSNFHGVCLTYAGIHSNPHAVRAICNSRTLVMLDEVHHAADQLPWGNAIRTAFEPSFRRLCMSGTPFRSDNNPIPFVKYIGGESHADFTYSYGEALKDGVVRPIIFQSWDGQMKWRQWGKEFESDFLEDLNDGLRNKRLATALAPENDFIKDLLKAASVKLDSLRVEHPEAGGLVTAPSIWIAEQYAAILKKINGEDPFLITSEDPRAAEEIKRFARGRCKWAVSPKMISEGVSIPRLRVGVYSTNITTEMYFRQFVGRFVRVQKGREDDYGYVFILRDPRHFNQALEIEKERLHYIEELENADNNNILDPDKRREANPTGDKLAEAFEPRQAFGKEDAVVHNGDIFEQFDIQEADRIREKYAFAKNIEATQILSLIRDIRSSVRPDSQQQPVSSTGFSVRDAPDDPEYVTKKKKQKYIGILVNELANLKDVEHKVINGQLKAMDGNQLKDCSIDQMDARIKALKREILRLRSV